MYIAILEDEEGTQWVYEGEVQGQPIWIARKDARPKLLSENDAWKIAVHNRGEGETPRAERA